jgi:hypothetical protein
MDIAFDSPEDFYTFYYDESNNARELSINEDEHSYNIDNDKRQVAAANFMLAGIAHSGATSTANIEELFNKLRLPPSAKELKFNQVAKGKFDAVLKSSRITTVLEWTLKSDLYLHYFNLNLEYWSFIDIVEDCVIHCLESQKLRFVGDQHFRHYMDYHKDALYRLIRARKTEFISLIKQYGYPSIKGNEAAFVAALNTLVTAFTEQLICQALSQKHEEIVSLKSLAELFDLCRDINDMTLTLGSEENLLIDGFSVFYESRIKQFPHSQHVFDEEDEVEREFNKLAAYELLPTTRYRFINSKLDPFVQVADVIAGLFARYFDFIEKNSYEDLQNLATRLTHHQKKNIDLMRALIEKTDERCSVMLFYVMTLTEHHKHRLFLFPDEQ